MHEQPNPRRRSRSTLGIALAAAMVSANTTSHADGPFLFIPEFTPFPDPHVPTMIALGDLDGDGDEDVVVTGRGETHVVYVMMNEGSGFSAPVPFEVGGQTDWAELVDVDNDGSLDMCVAVRAFRGRLQVYRGLGDGSFESAGRELVLGREPRCVVAADFDGDGDQDFAGLDHREPTCTIHYNDGTGEFRDSSSFLVAGSSVSNPYPQAMVTDDLDGDGAPDLIVDCLGSSRIQILRNRGDGSFEPAEGWRPPRVLEEIGGIAAVALGDIDLDGRSDPVVPMILIDSPSHVGVLRRTEDESAIAFEQRSAAPSSTTGFAFSIDLGDLDGDGDVDVIVGHALPGRVTVLDNRTIPVSEGGDGSIVFEAFQPVLQDSFFRDVAVCDLDGDCDLDLLAVDLVANGLYRLENVTPQESGCSPFAATADRARLRAGSRVGTVRRPAVTLDEVAPDGCVDGRDVAKALADFGLSPASDFEEVDR